MAFSDASIEVSKARHQASLPWVAIRCRTYADALAASGQPPRRLTFRAPACYTEPFLSVGGGPLWQARLLASAVALGPPILSGVVPAKSAMGTCLGDPKMSVLWAKRTSSNRPAMSPFDPQETSASIWREWVSPIGRSLGPIGYRLSGGQGMRRREFIGLVGSA